MIPASIAVDGHIAWDVPDAEYARLLGYPHGHVLEGEVAVLAAQSRSWFADNARPSVRLVEIPVLAVDGPEVRLAGATLTGHALASRLAEAHAMVGMAATAGSEVDLHSDRQWTDRPDAAYFLDRIGAAVTEHLVGAVGAQLCQLVEPEGISVLAPLSPGCSDWPLTDQPRIGALLKAAHPDLPVEVLDSGALIPKNAVLAVYGLTRREVAWEARPAVRNCPRCTLAGCAFRRPTRG